MPSSVSTKISDVAFPKRLSKPRGYNNSIIKTIVLGKGPNFVFLRLASLSANTNRSPFVLFSKNDHN
ncbi:hypothetical protein SJA_C1-31790 [Sphingobium indicum UT26S]|uniref:Uncharacterized protein n=1 Tax=Sphingobium indicum (strain DSM 16413 / CCM 7287 / MTCC 6362 / UT26 / NBRC 101211 / UT26S) TaxID=452662 RepID=D4Z5Y1_SPHIU|nr:hypothetical protein SJA_C1-31790 [Sphingobium indicum UT26S]